MVFRQKQSILNLKYKHLVGGLINTYYYNTNFNHIFFKTGEK